MNILRSVVKGFDLANPEDAYNGPDTTDNIRGAAPTPAETDAWKLPRHPSKPEVKLLDVYTLKPDLEAVTDSGAYMITKFSGNPTPSTEARDIRMDVGILYPRELASGSYDYEFFLPASDLSTENIKRKLDVNDMDCGDPALYTNKAADGSGVFKYDFLRTYEPGRQFNQPDQQYREVALALHDPELYRQTASAEQASHQGPDPLSKGAYYYPIATKMQLKPRRNKNLAQLGLAGQAMDDDAQKIDAVHLIVNQPSENEVAKRRQHRDQLIPDSESLDGDP